MIDTIVEARRFGAGAIQTALAAPVGPEDRPRTIGPFAVLAHALPLEVAPGALAPDFDVRPHPHLGLAAVTYLLAGHVTHRDSLGSRSEVGPGGVHYMVAGRGVVHSERFDRLRTLGGTLELLQILLALPDGAEDAEPSFVHVGAAAVPARDEAGAAVHRLDEPIGFPAPLLLHDVRLDAGGRYAPPEDRGERAIYVLAGEVEIDGVPVRAQQTAVLAPGPARLTAAAPARALAFGGAPVGPRYMWWNYIHSSLERVEAARAEWRAGRVGLPPGDTESFTPAPPDEGRPLLRLNAAG